MRIGLRHLLMAAAALSVGFVLGNSHLRAKPFGVTAISGPATVTHQF